MDRYSLSRITPIRVVMSDIRIDSTLVDVADLTCLADALAWACDRLARDLAEPTEVPNVESQAA